ncbi:MAG: hypothetical protein HPZ91_03240 [Lentisphaeria bacterium]|nr:hypothetical protein [Lentisphaeria bacterium]
MKKLFLLAVAAIAGTVVMTGCTAVNTNDAANDFKAEIVPAKFETVINHKDTPVSGEAQLNVLFNVFSWGVSEFADRSFVGSTNNSLGLFQDPQTLAKQGATYNACKNASCDVLLNAKYIVTTTDYFVFKMINCKVTGYPGTEAGIKAVK